MRYAALAIDYDGTLATHGRVAADSVRALDELAASGRRLVLVTGRELDELLGIFPEIGVFDRVVAENGALLYTPATRLRRALAEPPPPDFVRELARRGVAPLSAGQTIVATVHPNEAVVLETIRDLGLELQVIFNKGAVMVLPAAVNKATGLRAALDEIGLSLRNAVAIGDAENDHALLRAAEYGVAVANAVAMLQAEADRISAHENGAAVRELAGDILAHDLAATPSRVQRRRIALGARAEGGSVCLAGDWRDMLVAGPPGSGKADFVASVLERLAAEGYQFLVFDASDAYAGVGDAIVLGDAVRAPGAAEVLAALERPQSSLVLKLGAVAPDGRAAYCAEIWRRLEALRAQKGRPHWIVIDEADRLIPRDGSRPADAEPVAATGAILVTARPERIDPAALRTVDAAFAFGSLPQGTLRRFARAAAVEIPETSCELRHGEALAWTREAGSATTILATAPRTGSRGDGRTLRGAER